MSLQTRMDLLGTKTRTKKGIFVWCAYRCTISVSGLVLTPICVTFGVEISLFVLVICVCFCMLVLLMFCFVLLYATCIVLSLVRACCLLNGNAPELGWATAPKPPPGGAFLRRPGIRGSHQLVGDRGVVPSQTHVYFHARH